jgi:hypothetical protein
MRRVPQRSEDPTETVQAPPPVVSPRSSPVTWFIGDGASRVTCWFGQAMKVGRYGDGRADEGPRSRQRRTTSVRLLISRRGVRT